MNSIYPVNVFGIKQIGVEKWLNNYFMPVTGLEYKSIYEFVLAEYIKHFCNESEDTIYWLSIANIKLASIVANEIFQLLRIERLQQRGYKFLIGKTKQPIAIIGSLDTSKDIRKKFSINKASWKTNKKKRIQFYYSYLNALLNKQLNPFSEKTYYVGNLSKEMLNYSSEAKITPFNLSYCTDVKLKNLETNKLDIFTERIQIFFSSISNEFPILDQNSLEKLTADFEHIFRQNYLFQLANLLTFEKLKSTCLLATGLGSPINRTLIALWRQLGREVIGFPHGNTYATCYDTIHVEHDGLSIVNKLFASSRGQASLLSKLSRDFSRGLKMAETCYTQKSVYAELFSKLQQEPKVEKIKKVMVVGFPMGGHIYPSFPAHHAFSNLFLEIRICKILKEGGFDVLYKAHPDRLNEVQGIFDNIVDDVLVAPFEQCYKAADCIVFGHSKTTTFGFAMLTKKPIVLINSDTIMWDDEAIDLVARRCRIVNATSNNNDQIIFEKKDFLAAIADSLHSINYDVINKFAL